jgi:hypothetical protein
MAQNPPSSRACKRITRRVLLFVRIRSCLIP